MSFGRVQILAIDTIKLSYPVDGLLLSKYFTFSDRFQKISPDGEVIWERTMCQTSLPSHFSGLRINYVNAAEMQKQGFVVVQSRMEFEFSLQKWHSETGYNNKNTAIGFDMLMLYAWIKTLSEVFEYDFKNELFVPCRVDISENYILKNGSIDDFIRSLELKFSSHVNGEKKIMRFDGAVQYGSTWIGKKIYSKFREFEAIEKKKHRRMYAIKEGETMKQENGKRILNESEISELVRMLRFEVEFRKKFLQKKGIHSIESIPLLMERFAVEKQKYLTVKNIRSGDVTLSATEYKIVDLCKRYGYQGAKEKYMEERTEQAFYKHRRNLIQKGIYLEAIINADWRLDIDKVDSMNEFVLEVAA